MLVLDGIDRGRVYNVGLTGLMVHDVAFTGVRGVRCVWLYDVGLTGFLLCDVGMTSVCV